MNSESEPFLPDGRHRVHGRPESQNRNVEWYKDEDQYRNPHGYRNVERRVQQFEETQVRHTGQYYRNAPRERQALSMTKQDPNGSSINAKRFEGHAESNSFPTYYSEQTHNIPENRAPRPIVYWNSKTPSRYRWYPPSVKHKREVKTNTPEIVATREEVTVDTAQTVNDASNAGVRRAHVNNEPPSGIPPTKRRRMPTKKVQMLKISTSEHGRVVVLEDGHISNRPKSQTHPPNQVADRSQHFNAFNPVPNRKPVDRHVNQNREKPIVAEKLTNPHSEALNLDANSNANDEQHENDVRSERTAATTPNGPAVRDRKKKRKPRKNHFRRGDPSTQKGRNIDDVINTFGDMSLNSKEVNQRSLMDLISEVGEKQKQQQILLREIESRLTRGKPLDTKTHPFQVDRVATSVQTSTEYVDVGAAVGPEPSTSFQTVIDDGNGSYHPNKNANGSAPYASPASGTRSPSYSSSEAKEPSLELPTCSLPASENMSELYLNGDQSIQLPAESNDSGYFVDF